MPDVNRSPTAKVVLWTVLATVGVLLLVVLVIPYTGWLHVAANEPDADTALHWYLETTRENSIAAQAADIRPPPDLGSAQRIDRGLVAYHQMCVMCHGAPGAEPGWIARGLSPEPPPLADAAARDLGEATAARDFWVIRNGIRMTGMAALAPTHSDEEMWDLVAFLQELPAMTPAEYSSAVEAAGLSPSESGHRHETPSPAGATGEHGHDGQDEHTHDGDDTHGD